MPGEADTRGRSDAFHANAIGMGEIGVAQGDGSLRTFVGSCVGLAMYCQREKVAGLAHIVLPDSKGKGEPAGKYADTAIPETIRLLEKLVGRHGLRLSAKMVGGAKMFAFQKGTTIGDQNIAAVERILRDCGIPVLARCCGGEKGRRVSLDVGTGAIRVETMGFPEELL
jgi:chemotaxis protein CheD